MNMNIIYSPHSEEGSQNVKSYTHFENGLPIATLETVPYTEDGDYICYGGPDGKKYRILKTEIPQADSLSLFLLEKMLS